MSYQNFKPNVTSAIIEKARRKKTVHENTCTKKYEGELSQAGDTVTILDVGEVTVHTKSDGKAAVFGEAEVVANAKQQMKVNQVAYWSFVVPDLDKSQAKGNLEGLIKNQAPKQIAEKHDEHIASMSLDPVATRMNATAPKLTKTIVLEQVDAALAFLYENNVPTNEDISVIVPPWVWFIMKQRIIELDTDNSKLIETGDMAMYGGCKIKMSNSYAIDGSEYLLPVKTNQAIAFVNTYSKVKAQPSSTSMGDEVRGESLYQAKIVRPKEIAIVNVTK